MGFFFILQIGFDFDTRFPEVNTLAFKDYWESGSEKLESIFQRFYPAMTFHTQWPKEIERFAIFLRLFPAKNKSTSEVFPKAIEKLITFKTVYLIAHCDISNFEKWQFNLSLFT